MAVVLLAAVAAIIALAVKLKKQNVAVDTNNESDTESPDEVEQQVPDDVGVQTEPNDDEKSDIEDESSEE